MTMTVTGQAMRMRLELHRLMMKHGSVRNLVCEAMMMGSEGASHGDREGLA